MVANGKAITGKYFDLEIFGHSSHNLLDFKVTNLLGAKR